MNNHERTALLVDGNGWVKIERVCADRCLVRSLGPLTSRSPYEVREHEFIRHDLSFGRSWPGNNGELHTEEIRWPVYVEAYSPTEGHKIVEQIASLVGNYKHATEHARTERMLESVVRTKLEVQKKCERLELALETEHARIGKLEQRARRWPHRIAAQVCTVIDLIGGRSNEETRQL